MLISKQDLEKSYEQHPSFSLKVQPMGLDDSLLSRFVENYKVISGNHGRLDIPELKLCEDICLQNLDLIFELLRHQASDNYEALFLDELLFHIKRLIGDEVKHYSVLPSAMKIKFSSQASRSSAHQLMRERYFFGKIGQTAVQEILALGGADLARFRQNVAKGNLTREDLSVNQGPVIKKIIRILNRVFKMDGTLDSLSFFTGRKMAVSGCALELSVPQARWWKNQLKDIERAPETLYAHIDESIWAPKSIVYLTDVTRETGATSCYPGVYESLELNSLQELLGRVVGNVTVSPKLKEYYGADYHQTINSDKFRRHWMRLPVKLRFNSHFGWDIMPGSEAEKKLMKAEKTLVGPAGTFIVFDGARLLHRGGMLKSGERIALQVVFSESRTFFQRAAGKVKKLARLSKA